MSRVDCEQLRDVAPELALGLLTGRERAACLAHLESCGACRAEVSGLAVTADDVLLAGPRSTPPPGFDRRVLDRLTAAGAFSPDAADPSLTAPGPLDDLGRPADAGDRRSLTAPGPLDGVGRAADAGDRRSVTAPGPFDGVGRAADAGDHRSLTAPGPFDGVGLGADGGGRRSVEHLHGVGGRGRPRRRVLAAVAVVVAVMGAVAGGLAGVAGLTGRDGPTSAAVATAEMRTGNGRLVGDATVRGDGPAVVTVDLPGWSELLRLYGNADGGGPYWLTVELDDGSRTMNRIPPDDTAWEVPLRAGAAEVAAVSVVDAEGRAWCTGRFPA